MPANSDRKANPLTRKTRLNNLRFTETRVALKVIGVTLTRKDGEFRVNLKGAAEATAYYTTDLDDALGTGQHMAAQKKEAGR